MTILEYWLANLPRISEISMIAPELVIVTTAMAKAGIVSARLSFVMGLKWGLRYETDSLRIFQIIATVIAAVLAGFGAGASITFGGLVFGIAAVLLTLPCVGLGWLLIVAGNRTIENILTGGFNRVEEVIKQGAQTQPDAN